MHQVAKWDLFEWTLKGPEDGNPFRDVVLQAFFEHRGRRVTVNGFYDGAGQYIIRFMPDMIGDWTFVTHSNVPELDRQTGQLTCTAPRPDNHGPVRVSRTYHFSYEDGTPYYPIGTTCYAWIHQGSKLEQQTLQTLEKSPFNKIRMCVFPKHYLFNTNEPELYPFVKNSEENWDDSRFNPDFFRHLEDCILELAKRGIEADLILFHPYDRWGFARMDHETDVFYLRYLLARLSAFHNVWWSFANEYDLMEKSISDWEDLAQVVVMEDPWQHLRSIHNCLHFYDHSRPWITHCSIQRVDWYRTSENVDLWREQYRKPVIVDECAYEGNIDMKWGSLTAEELVRRFWEGTVRGGYVGHGETYVHEDDILWWSKGGVLHGQSAERIAFLRRILEDMPIDFLDYAPSGIDRRNLPCGGAKNEYYLCYFGFNQPSYMTFSMEPGITYQVDIIDTWNMTIESVEETQEGHFCIDLPGRPYMAVRLTKKG